MGKEKKKFNLALIMIIYLLGIFMGAIDTGIVTPARTVIQNFLSVDEKTGIWMITMYTLAYAASIPIMGKLADKYGRKYIYLVSISLFGLGSLFCGLSQNFGSFTVLLIARAVQAIGGGGILPVATAEFGTTFPKEKRGMALGLVGAVYGVANIVGASAGSAILDLFGTNNWQFIFYVNVPITLFIIIAGVISLPNTKEENVKKTDYIGTLLLTVMILSVLYGLKNIDFFDFTKTITSTSVFPYLIIFIVLLPFFCFAENKAEDPVMNLQFFRNFRIIITLILSFITGVIIMGMIFVPQFAENALEIASGKGGYFVFILGLFAGIGAPLSGKLIDKYGVKIVLGFGFFISAAGALFLVFVTTNHPNMLTVFISLILVGTGIGFTMGTPINYMMLENTRKEEANSALATVSLIRSIGTAIAPAIMIGFISHAGAAAQDNIMPLLPTQVRMPQLPYAQELNDTLTTLKSNPAMKDKLAGVEIPDLTSMQTINIDQKDKNNKFEMSQDLIDLMRSSDVTTITENVKILSKSMMELESPTIISNIQQGIQSGIAAMDKSSNDMDNVIQKLQTAVKSQDDILVKMEQMNDQLTAVMSRGSSPMSGMLSGKSVGIANPSTTGFSLTNMIPDNVKATMSDELLSELNNIKSMEDYEKEVEKLKTAKQELEGQITTMKRSKDEMKDTENKMVKLKDAIPDAFAKATDNYLSDIDKISSTIEKEFQDTLNVGFKQVYLTVMISSALGFFILLFYRKRDVDNV